MRFLQDTLDVIRQRAKVAPLDGAVNVDNRLHVVVRDHTRTRPGVICASPPRYCNALIPGRDRHIHEVRHGVYPVLRHLRHNRVRHAVFGIKPEVRMDLSAAGERNQQAIGNVALSQALLRWRAPDRPQR